MTDWTIRARRVWSCFLTRSESGQAAVLVAVMLPLLLAIIGLAIDGGVVFTARRELQNVADSAARAGAMQIDEQAYRDSAGESIVLDTGAARQVAAQYVASQGRGMSAVISAEPERVVVQVSRDAPTSFLRLVGIGTVRISATAPAEVRHGIASGSR